MFSLHLVSLIFPGVKLASDKQFTGFLEGLGPAQLAGRQTLATPPMGKTNCSEFLCPWKKYCSSRQQEHHFYTSGSGS